MSPRAECCCGKVSWHGGAEIDGHENERPPKLQGGAKLQDMNLTDQVTGHEKAGHQITVPEIA